MPRRLITLLSLGPLLVSGLFAQDALSEKLRGHIQSTLPAYNAPASTDPAPTPELETVITREPIPLSDDPIVHLPDFSVDSHRRVPNRDPDLWLSQKGRTNTALRDYANGMTALEWALNSWHIPLVTPSAQSRANEEYRSKRIKLEQSRLADLASTVRQFDAADGARLLRDVDLTGLPRR